MTGHNNMLTKLQNEVATEMHIIALNQMAGPLFFETTQFIAESLGRNTIIITGHPDTINKKENNVLKIIDAPEYERRGLVYRLLSWVKYTLFCIPYIIKESKNTFFLISTNPPIIGLIFNIINKIKKHSYGLIIYDIYPDVLVNARLLNKNSYPVKLWMKSNQKLIEESNFVITLSNGMRDLLLSQYNCVIEKINVIYPWVNTDYIKPLAPENNPYYQKFNPENKFVVLYSGNMGNSHDIDTILDAAKILEDEKDILFIFFGVGEKWESLYKNYKKNKFSNIKVFPLQPNHIFPYSINIGDISIVSLEQNSDSLMIPSKLFYYLAAGSPVIGICDSNSEMNKILIENNVGFSISHGETQSLAEKIILLYKNDETLKRIKKLAREIALTKYSKEIGGRKLQKKINKYWPLKIAD